MNIEKKLSNVEREKINKFRSVANDVSNRRCSKCKGVFFEKNNLHIHHVASHVMIIKKTLEWLDE